MPAGTSHLQSNASSSFLAYLLLVWLGHRDGLSQNANPQGFCIPKVVGIYHGIHWGLEHPGIHCFKRDAFAQAVLLQLRPNAGNSRSLLEVSLPMQHFESFSGCFKHSYCADVYVSKCCIGCKDVLGFCLNAVWTQLMLSQHNAGRTANTNLFPASTHQALDYRATQLNGSQTTGTTTHTRTLP